MYRLVYFLLLITAPVFSQSKKDFVTYNKVTFDFYEKEAWDQLIITGMEALNNNYDFFNNYYLQVQSSEFQVQSWNNQT